MAAYVGGERSADMGHRGYLFERFVGAPQCRFVFSADVAAVVVFRQYRQERVTRGRAGMPLVENPAYVRIKSDADFLSRLVAAVDYFVAHYVGMSQICGVDETHAPAVEEKQEYIAGKVECGQSGKVESLDASDFGQRDGAFGSFLDAGVGFAKRSAVRPSSTAWL